MTPLCFRETDGLGGDVDFFVSSGLGLFDSAVFSSSFGGIVVVSVDSSSITLVTNCSVSSDLTSSKLEEAAVTSTSAAGDSVVGEDAAGDEGCSDVLPSSSPILVRNQKRLDLGSLESQSQVDWEKRVKVLQLLRMRSFRGTIESQSQKRCYFLLRILNSR